MRLLYTLLLNVVALCLYAQGTVTYDISSGLPHWVVTGVTQDSRGFIWVATWNGLCRYDGYEFVRINAAPGDGTDISSGEIRRMKRDGKGNIVCCTYDGFFVFDTGHYRLYDAKQRHEGRKLTPCASRSFTDSEGNTWGRVRYGLAKTMENRHPAQLVEGTEEYQARAFMTEDGGRWWLATKEDECIRIFDADNRLVGYLGKDGGIHAGKTPFGYRAYCMMQSRNGDVWVGCKPGALLRLRKVSAGKYDIRRLDSSVCDTIYHIVEDNKGRIWLASFGGGVQCVTSPDASAPLTFRETVGQRVRRLLITPAGNVVGCTANGLLLGCIDRQDVRKSRFRMVTREGKRRESLTNNETRDVAMDGKGRIFVATANYGIDMAESEKALFGRQPAFRHFNTDNSSLTSDVCIAMTARDDGRLLVVSMDRVMDFDPEKDHTTTFAHSFWSDRCHFSEERPMRLPDGSWIFGQEQGAYIATEQSMEKAEFTPPLQFTRLHVNEGRNDIGVCGRDTIEMGTDERNFTLSFAALCYQDNSEIRYRSRIDGQPWSRAGSQRTITFYDARPGTYVVEIQSTDRYGRWTGNNRRLTIIVKPHWYETLWTRTAGVVLCMMFITAVIYAVFYIKALNRQRRELLEKYMAVLNHAGEAENNTRKDGDDIRLSDSLSDKDSRFLQMVREYIENNIGNSGANIDDMALYAATSRSNLNRKLRSLAGVTAAQLLIDARMQRACRLLEAHDLNGLSISEIAYKCGYSDARYFSRCFKTKYGVAPSEYSVVPSAGGEG